MFAPEFFPTPPALAERLVDPYVGKVTSVMDPSAGEGALLKPFFGTTTSLYAIESEPRLRSVLHGYNQKYSNEPRIRVVGEDVFTYQGAYLFDLVAVNPPFSEWKRHLTAACKLVAPGGTLAAILPIRDDDDATEALAFVRQLLGVTAEVEYELCGPEFRDAERKTEVHVGILRAEKPAQENTVDFGAGWRPSAGFTKEEAVPDLENQLVRNDYVGNTAKAFELAVQALQELRTAWSKAEFYLGASGVDLGHLAGTFRLPSMNGLLDWAQEGAWDSMLSTSRISNMMTGRMNTEFRTFLKQQKQRTFTRENIFQLIETLILSRKSIADQCVQDVFDILCKFDEKNRLYGNVGVGWKTNDAHRVNRKVIVPHLVEYSFNRFGIVYSQNYSQLDDIDKAMCVVAGKSFDQISTLRTSIQDRFKSNTGEGESEFFTWKAYKKGTLHLTFKDEEVWRMFNVTAAKQKGWLPS